MPGNNPSPPKPAKSKSPFSPGRLLRRVQTLPKDFKPKLPKSLQPGRASIKRFIKAVGKTAKYGVYGPSSEQVAAKAAKGGGGQKAVKGTVSKAAVELKPMSPVGRGAQGSVSPGGSVKETTFTVTKKPSMGLKSFGPKQDVYKSVYGNWLQMDSIPPGTQFTPAPIREFSPAMKARASQVLGGKPVVTAPPRYPTLESIKSGEALKQAYTAADPIGHLKKALKGAIDRAPSLRVGDVTSTPSLGGQPLPSARLFKNIKGHIDTLNTLKTEVAIVKNRQYQMDEGGKIVGAESHKDYLKRLKATEKRLKTAEKNTKKLLKNAQKTLSKQADHVFRQNQKAADASIRLTGAELKGLANNLRADLKWIQKVPVASNDIALSGGPAEASSYRERYKPQSQSDRAVKFDQRWRDGRAEIQRVDQKITVEIDRIKAMRGARDWVKGALNKQVNQVLNDANGLKSLKGAVKGQIRHAKQRMAAQRTAARAARLARMRRFMRI